MESLSIEALQRNLQSLILDYRSNRAIVSGDKTNPPEAISGALQVLKNDFSIAVAQIHIEAYNLNAKQKLALGGSVKPVVDESGDRAEYERVVAKIAQLDRARQLRRSVSEENRGVKIKAKPKKRKNESGENRLGVQFKLQLFGEETA